MLLRARTNRSGMQRKVDEKLWLVQIDVVKVLYGVDFTLYVFLTDANHLAPHIKAVDIKDEAIEKMVSPRKPNELDE